MSKFGYHEVRRRARLEQAFQHAPHAYWDAAHVQADGQPLDFEPRARPRTSDATYLARRLAMIGASARRLGLGPKE